MTGKKVLAKNLKIGMRFQDNAPYWTTTATPCLITSIPYINKEDKITFTAVYDEPWGAPGNIYDVFWLDPNAEVNLL